MKSWRRPVLRHRTSDLRHLLHELAHRNQADRETSDLRPLHDEPSHLKEPRPQQGSQAVGLKVLV